MKSAKASLILRAANLSVVRSGFVLLDNLFWSMKSAERWVILGANGSGKTSLLSALTGYLTPSAGTIELLGERYGRSNWPELRKRIGLVSSSIRQMMNDSEPAVSAVISGKYAMIDCWKKPSRNDRATARRLLRQMECGALADRPWLFLSQGERQRVLIGRALMAEPELLILDEPCAGLDPAAREHFLQFLQRLAKTPRAPAVVLVTHHVEEITPIFTHVLLLKQGRVVAAGRKGAILNSQLLTETFDAACRVRKVNRRFTMTVQPRRGRIL